jgi:putative peptidoglycan lipid II flippase
MLRSSLFVTALSLFNSFLGLIVQVLVAKRYGSGLDVDAYLYAISAPTFVAGMIASMLSYTVVPRMAHSDGCSNKESQFIVSILALSVFFAVILMLSSPLMQMLQKAMLPNGSPILQQPDLPSLLFLGWCIAALQVLSAVLSAILTGLKQAFTATLLNLGPYVGMLGFMVVVQNTGIEVLALGLLCGTAATFAVALYILRAQILGQWRQPKWADVSSLVLRSPYTIIAMSCFSAFAVIDSYWGPRAGDGVLASLGYAQRIMIALGNLAVAGPSAILVPKFSEIVVKKDRVRFEQMFNRVIVIALIVGFSLVLFLYLGAESLVKLIFMRGAFNQNDAMQVASVLQWYLPGMLCMLLSVISLRVLFCFPNVEGSAAAFGILWVVFYFVCSGLLVSLGAKGLAVSYSIAWIAYVFCILLTIKKISDAYLATYSEV